MTRGQAMFGSSPSNYQIVGSESVLLPRNSSNFRTLVVRSEKMLAIDIPAGASVELRARFAVWKRGSVVEAAMDPVAVTVTGASPSTRVVFTPLPGYLFLDVRSTVNLSIDVALTISDVVPANAVLEPQYAPVSIGDLPTGSGSTSTLGDFFDGAFLNQFEMQRAPGGVWRTDLAERIGDFVVTSNDAGKRIVLYQGREFQVCYVFPTADGATDVQNDGNDPRKPRQTLVGGTLSPLSGSRCFLVLESGCIFDRASSLNGFNPTHDLIIVASQPGVPAILSALEPVSTDLSGTWTSIGNSEYTSTVAEFNSLPQVNLIQYDQLDPFGRPRLIPFNTTVNSIAGSVMAENQTRKLRVFSDQTSPPVRAFVHRQEAANSILHGSRLLIVRDVEFWGGSNSFNVTQQQDRGVSAYFHRCAFRFNADSFTGDTPALGSRPCLGLTGNIYAYLLECAITDSLGDGLDGRGYFIANTPLRRVHVLEDRLLARFCGLHPADRRRLCQASTMHIGGRVLRVGSEYGFTGGPNLQDVFFQHENSYAGIFGCFAYGSQGTSQGVQQCLVLGSSSTDRCYGWLLEFTFGDKFGEHVSPGGQRILIHDLCLVMFDKNYVAGKTGSVDVFILPTGSIENARAVCAVPRL